VALGGTDSGPGPNGQDPSLEAVRAHLDQDLDTPGALAALDAAARSGASVVEGATLLGVTL
jgi:L-cysteine:1D-myo-inositol 2-amino-2-deoxy-alpha-D-glucopyranoside ligase